jgi:ligand-binding sensor domain-containing protein
VLGRVPEVVLQQGRCGVRRILIVMTACALLAPGAALAESGGWEIFVDASAINRIDCVGDSIWCSTRGGILIFNLGDSSFVQHLGGLAFRSTDVSGVARDDRGSVWASFTTSGVARIDHFGSAQPSVKLYSSTIDGLMSDSVACIASAGNDVYYGSTGGIAKFYDNLHSLEPVLSDSLEGVSVRDLLVRGDTLWIACERGVARFLRSTFNFTMYRIGSATSLCAHSGAIHVAGADGVQRFDGSAWVSLGRPGGFVPLAVASGAGTLYCVTNASAYRRDGSSWTDITANMKGLFSQKYTIWSGFNTVKTIAVDPRGTAWVAGLEAQINRGSYLSAYRSNSWINKAPENLSQNGIVAVSIAPGQGVWASTRYFGISYRSNAGRWTTYSKMRTPADEAGLTYYLNNIALLYDSQGYLWCGAFLDLDRVKINDPFIKTDDEWAHYALNEGTITTNRFVRAKEDPEGNRWFLSDDVLGGEGQLGINILKADGTAWLSVTPSTAPGMAGGSVFDVSFGAGGVAYLALRGYGVQAWYTGGYDWAELSDLASDGWNTLIEPGDLASKELYAVESGSDGAVWVGTASGLVRWQRGAIDSFTVKTSPGERGLVGAAVFDLEFDGAGNLWVGTEQGLNKITPDGAIEAFTSVDAWKGDLYPSSVISPLPSPVCGSLVYDRTGNVLWIGTANGLVRFDVTPVPPVTESLSRMILYPNPVHISRGDGEVKISRISNPVSIRVYTIEGELVHSVDGVRDGERAWDLLTLNGFKARSGIYVVKVSDGRSTETRKIAIIR